MGAIGFKLGALLWIKVFKGLDQHQNAHVVEIIYLDRTG